MATDPLRAIDIMPHNRNLILSNIYNAQKIGGISQSELVARTGLKPATIFRIFSSLEEEGLIEINSSDSEVKENHCGKKGRKPAYYTINPDARFVIAIEFWVASISIGVFNFAGICIKNEMHNLDSDADGDSVVQSMISIINDLIDSLSLPREKIIGIGISAPGKISIKEGMILYYSRIKGMVDYPLKEKLESTLGFDVLVHNNSCLVTSNSFNNRNLDCGSSTYSIVIRNGAGGALVTKDGIFISSDGTTFEAGHVSILPDGPECECGMRGCLQACILQLDKEYRGDSSDSKLVFSSLSDPLTKKDPQALKVVDRAAWYIYLAMRQARLYFSPDSFMLFCNSMNVSEAIVARLRELFQSDSDRYKKRIPSIFPLVYSSHMAQRGAFQLVLNKYLSV